MKFSIFEVDKLIRTVAGKASWDRQTDDRNLVWFRKKISQILMTTFTYRSSSCLFYAPTTTGKIE